MRLLKSYLPLLLSVAALSCGSSSPSSSSAAGPIAGNWQIALVRHNSTEQWIFSGFLKQSGSKVSGSVVLSAGCQGVGPVTGTFDGQNLQLTIGASGQDFSLSATLPSVSDTTSSMSGQFTTSNGGCVGFDSSGDWTAVRVSPLTGPFHGSFSQIGQNAIDIEVIGTLTQGPNIGASTAMISGTMTATGPPAFCSYVSTANVTGTISGTSLSLTFYGPEGTKIGQMPAPGFALATVAPDATTVNGSFQFPAIASSCPQLNSTAGILTFP